MSRVKFIIHKGKEILFIDFSNCKVEEIKPITEEAKAIIAVQPPNSLLTLTDVTETRYNHEATKTLKEYVAHNRPYVKFAAVIGVTGLKKVVYDGISMFAKRKLALFNSIEIAKDWLVEQ